ncbi:hypothetical protein ACTFIW_002334 [Dictyostelium discoideum]|uniref:DNA-directed RNA polymerase II subunit rpb11 n=1 Tax=Dictyostelium discoideum TaxID=44689 RepID=RPB11_DICDI|nr:RNA polymerase II core subunit [Dictyostelium discoideum AX4]Q86JJ5.1 RecName: Full=DNA-directed RNA polymerase II subunit rpb11; Short=RNA polymerase II subunit B11; AltName: Full=DNA-directed RNA polymerase II subunit J [Dictyostelium discoideum]EAL68596.2 RNA polymerase II core subunit [Dictyostelium discoideum AX4]|eukprot:XP_642530.2 RNA polymerase II core subunit [Dictyostelium discoideum AX4]
MNAPDRFELFVLPDGAKKVTMVRDTKIPNASMFTILKEDHTIGNLIRMQLIADQDIIFAGYRMPHPLEHNVNIRIQTNNNTNPLECVQKSMECLSREFTSLENSFIEQVQKKRNVADQYI